MGDTKTPLLTDGGRMNQKQLDGGSLNQKQLTDGGSAALVPVNGKAPIQLGDGRSSRKVYCHEVCRNCGWKDDKKQAADPELRGESNEMSLNEAKRAFKNGGKIR